MLECDGGPLYYCNPRLFPSWKATKGGKQHYYLLNSENPQPHISLKFKPIFCCNVVYKCISKILANWLLFVLPSIIGKKQCAFVPCKRIADNIILAHELVHVYHSRRGPLRCALKVDLLKHFKGRLPPYHHPC